MGALTEFRTEVKRGGKPLLLYHATHRKFKEIDPSKGGGMAFFSERPRTSDFGKNVFKAYLKISNPFEFLDDQVKDVVSLISETNIIRVLRDYDIEDWNTPEEQLIEYLSSSENYGLWQNDIVVSAIKRAGYDGVITSDTHGGEMEYVVFDKRQIVPVVGESEPGPFERLVDRMHEAGRSSVDVGSAIGDKYGIKMWAFMSDRVIDLQEIEVPKERRGKGLGTKAIEDLQALARKHNLPIVLTPEPEPGKKAALERFYKNLGFKRPGGSRDYSLPRHTHIWRP